MTLKFKLLVSETFRDIGIWKLSAVLRRFKNLNLIVFFLTFELLNVSETIVKGSCIKPFEKKKHFQKWAKDLSENET